MSDRRIPPNSMSIIEAWPCNQTSSPRYDSQEGGQTRAARASTATGAHLYAEAQSGMLFIHACGLQKVHEDLTAVLLLVFFKRLHAHEQ